MTCLLVFFEQFFGIFFLFKDNVLFFWGFLDEDGLDDFLLELFDGEEDDGYFSFTEEEIQEFLKNDDVFDDDLLDEYFFWGGGLFKDDSRYVEKGGRGS